MASLTSIQLARIEIGKFQRELLFRLHKDGIFKNKAIQEVEREMDIDELHFEQQFPEQNT